MSSTISAALESFAHTPPLSPGLWFCLALQATEGLDDGHHLLHPSLLEDGKALRLLTAASAGLIVVDRPAIRRSRVGLLEKTS